MLGERAGLGEWFERFDHPLEALARPLDAGEAPLNFGAFVAVRSRLLDRASQKSDVNLEAIHQRLRAAVDVADLVKCARQTRLGRGQMRRAAQLGERLAGEPLARRAQNLDDQPRGRARAQRRWLADA